MEERIQRFINDEVLADAVYGIILESFLKPRRISDVQFLAASRIAIDLLNEAWKELEHYKVIKEEVGEVNATPYV